MKLTIGNEGRYNFHNMVDLNIVVKEENKIYNSTGKKVVAVELTPSQVKRIERHFCGMSDCCCGSLPAGMREESEGKWVIEVETDNDWANDEEAEYGWVSAGCPKM